MASWLCWGAWGACTGETPVGRHRGTRGPAPARGPGRNLPVSWFSGDNGGLEDNSPILQGAPLCPGGHTQAPVSGWHFSPGPHWHGWEQLAPNIPGEQPGREPRKQVEIRGARERQSPPWAGAALAPGHGVPLLLVPSKQKCPVQPGGQKQLPSWGWQIPPWRHWQGWEQLAPQCPRGHAAGNKVPVLGGRASPQWMNPQSPVSLKPCTQLWFSRDSKTLSHIYTLMTHKCLSAAPSLPLTPDPRAQPPTQNLPLAVL